MFSSNKKSSLFGANSPSPSSSTLLPAFGESTSSLDKSKQTVSAQSPATRRTGFEGFSGLVSPLRSAPRSNPPSWERNKSPSRKSNTTSVAAFSSYSSGKVHPFAIPSPKRVRASSPNGGSPGGSLERTTNLNDLAAEPDESEDEDEIENEETTFGEKLRATRDDFDDGKVDEEPKFVLTEQDGE